MQHFDLIRQWAEDRNIIDGSTPAKQLQKLFEEMCELSLAVHTMQASTTPEAYRAAQKEFVDGIGDCVVVLTNMAAQERLKIEDCIAHAYDQIKDRKGKMIDGIFVKEE